MEQAISSIQKLIWFAFRAIYTLIPPIIFMFSISAFIKSIDSTKLPSSINHFIQYLSDIHQTDKTISVVIYISAAVIIGLLTETISGIILWDKKYDQNGAADESSYLKKINFDIDTDLKVADVGYSDLVGVKIINEYESFNSFTWFIMSSKLMLLAIYIYLNFFLVFLIPFALAIHFELAPYWYFIAGGVEIILLFFLFLLNRWGLAKLKSKTPNWHDKVIAEKGELALIFLLPFILAFTFIGVSFFNPNCIVFNAFLILIGITFFLFPLKFFIVLGANNLHNRLRRMMNSAFVQLRYDDVIFRGNPKKPESIKN